MTWYLALVLAVIGWAVVSLLWRKLRSHQRAFFIRQYRFPKGLFDRLIKRHPELSYKDVSLVARGLRHFFLAYLGSGRSFVSMPSQVVDDLWHEFILYTRHYEAFCRQAFGGFLHHTPAVVLGSERLESNAGLRRVWWQCCKEENIHPLNPTRLPLLFALDAKLDIHDGFRYSTDCKRLRVAGVETYCGGDFSDASVDGGTSGFGDGPADAGLSSDGGGDGDGGGGDGGCGGGGCGGGGGD
jgi:hypothetical protein